MQKIIINNPKDISLLSQDSDFTYSMLNMVYENGIFKSTINSDSEGKFSEGSLPTITFSSQNKKRLGQLILKSKSFMWGDSDDFANIVKTRITLTEENGKSLIIEDLAIQESENDFWKDRYFFDVLNCLNIKIEVLSADDSSKKIQINEIGVTEYDKKGEFTKFKTFEIYENTNILSDDVAVNTCNFTIVGEYSELLQENSEFDVIKDNSYYGRFIITKCEQSDINSFEISAEDMKSKLKKFNYDKWRSNTSISAEKDIFLSSGVGIVNKYTGSFWGFVENNSCLFGLCQIAWTLNKMIDSSRASFITLRNVPTEITSYINNKNGRKKIIGDSKFTKSETFTQAKYKFIQYLLKDSAEKIGEFTAALSIPTKYYFPEAPCMFSHVEPSNIEITDSSDNYVELKTPGNTETSISVYAFKYEPVITEIMIPNSKSYSANATTNEKIYDKYTLTPFDPYDSKGSVLDLKSPYIKKFIESPGTVSAKIVVENERVGDLVQIETAFSGTFTGIITSMVLHLGYTDVADIEVRVWPYEGGLG